MSIGQLWKDIKTIVCVRTFGNVENMVTGRILQPRIDGRGYPIVDLYKNGKGKYYRKDGSVQEGEWVDDKFKESKKE